MNWVQSEANCNSVESEVIKLEDKNGVNPEKDCGTARCIYACENCPFYDLNKMFPQEQ